MKAECVEANYELENGERQSTAGCFLAPGTTAFGRMAGWLFSRLQRRRDAALIAAMDERELQDIGLYSHELPVPKNIEHENQRRKLMAYDGWLAGSTGFIRRP